MARNRIKVEETDVITVGTKFDEFITKKKIDGLAEKSIRSYCKLFKSIGIDRERNIYSIDWNTEIMKIREKSISPSSKNTYLRTIKVFMSWLNKTCDMQLELPIIKRVETIKEVYTDEELKLLIKEPKIKCSFNELRNWVIILLALDTGIRSASIRNILIKDIDLEANIMNIRHTKTHKVQVLPFSATTKAALKRYMKSRKGTPDDFVFCTIYGDQLTENGLSDGIAKYNLKRGVSKTSLHLVRHTFTKKQLLDCGVNPFTLKYMLGHSNMQMTNNYVNLYNIDIIKNYKSPIEALEKHRIL